MGMDITAHRAFLIEVSEFSALLGSQDVLKLKKDLLPFYRDRMDKAIREYSVRYTKGFEEDQNEFAGKYIEQIESRHAH